MDHGLYTNYLGMRARQRALDVMANNIANASTPGYKATRLLYRSVEAAEKEAGVSFNIPGQQPDLETAGLGGGQVDRSMASTHGSNVGVVTMATADFSPGQLRQTGRQLDIALDGDGFLAVRTARGERYTRAGSLRLNSESQLVTQGGDIVVGDRGPITVPPGEISIDGTGEVSVKGEAVGRLKIVRFDNPRAALLKEGESLFAAPDARSLEDTRTRVVQSSLEMSNVDAITEMAAMIQNSREFESLQRSITTMMNDLGRKVANEIGRI